MPLYRPIDLYGITRGLDWRPRPDEAIHADAMAFADLAFVPASLRP